MSSPMAMFKDLGKVDIQALLKFNDVTPAVQTHLAKTYATLMVMVCAAAAGSYLHIMYHLGGMMTTLATFGIIFYLSLNRNQPMQERVLFVTLFGLFKGLSIGGLVEIVMDIDPAIVLTALTGTIAVFACFSLAALVSKRRSMLYLGGILASALTALLWLSIANLFFRSVALFNMELYVGLLMFVGFVVFDTQMIVERASLGDKDYPMHALSLFLDFVAIFIRLLIILAKNTEKKEDRRNSRR